MPTDPPAHLAVPPASQPAPTPDPAALLPALLHQLAADLADPAITYLLAGHYYERTNHPHSRHFPAVFALRQGEVANFQVGANFVAFDTELVRYPDRGEPGYPGPHTDRFRATVPFAQLYQLCRQVFPPAGQAVGEVRFGPESVVYYNATAHGNQPSPADTNQAHAAPTAQHPLVAVFAALKAGLADPGNHYLVNTTCFATPAGPLIMGTLHLHTHTVRDFRLETDAFTCAVLLNPHERHQWSAVRVAFAQVWLVVLSDSATVDMEEVEEQGGILYDAPEVLRDYARQ